MSDKRRISRFLTVAALISLLCGFYFSIPQAFADSTSYFYDDLGRLTRAVKGTQGTIYLYDSLGNLLSVSNASTANASPVISSITPNVLFVGSELPVTISGQNLLTTESVIAVGNRVTIKNIVVTDTQITADMTALSAGVDTIRVTTDYGNPKTAEVGVDLSTSKLSISPGQLAIIPGTGGTLMASISPPLESPLTINLSSSDPTVATAPSAVTIPTNGSLNFVVNGLQEGVATISAGSTRAVVNVSPPFSGDISGLTAGRVSVYVDTPTGGSSPTVARPISVYLDAPTGVSSPAVSSSVSVYVDVPTGGTSPVVAPPVSVDIQ